MPAAAIPTSPRRDAPEFPASDRRHRVEVALAEAEGRLLEAIARYDDLVARGDEAVSAWDRRDDAPGRCNGLHVALALRHNHVCYHKGLVATLRDRLAREPKGPTPRQVEEIRRKFALGLFTRGRLARDYGLSPATIARLLDTPSGGCV